MAREHADLPDLPRHDDHLDVALVHRSVGRDEREAELPAGAGH
jgi:hypothetical protein